MNQEIPSRECGEAGAMEIGAADSPYGEAATEPLKRRASVDRHERKCGVCRHPEREAIEQDYLDWRSPETIARDYGIADHSSIYRHIRATGLRAKRNAPARRMLESIFERGVTGPITGSTIIRAVWAYTHLNDSGEWVEPPKVARVVRKSSQAATSNRQPERLENPQPIAKKEAPES
jgi:hypothetical protein